MSGNRDPNVLSLVNVFLHGEALVIADPRMPWPKIATIAKSLNTFCSSEKKLHHYVDEVCLERENALAAVKARIVQSELAAADLASNDTARDSDAIVRCAHSF